MIIIDYNDKRPIYEQIVERFQTLILNGILEPDTQIPSVRTLAIDLSINANTIQRAYSELERDGFIYSIKGRGNFVRCDESLIVKYRQKLINHFKISAQICLKMGVSKSQLMDELSLIEEGLE